MDCCLEKEKNLHDSFSKQFAVNEGCDESDVIKGVSVPNSQDFSVENGSSDCFRKIQFG